MTKILHKSYRSAAIIVALVMYSIPLSAETISLQEVEKIALSANSNVKIAQKRVEAAENARKIALTRFFPTITADLNGSLNGPEVKFGDKVITRKLSWGANIQGNITLLDMTLFPQYKAAKKRELGAQAAKEWTNARVLLEARQAYFQLQTAQRSLEIANKSNELRKKYAERADALVQRGIGLPIDAARAKSQILDAERMLLEAQNNLTTSANNLAIILNKKTDGTLRAEVSTTQNNEHSSDNANVSLSENLIPNLKVDIEKGRVSNENIVLRADIQQLDLAKTEAELSQSSAFWAFFPTIYAGANVRFGPPSFSAPDGFAWSATIGLRWTLLAGGARFVQKNQSDTQLEIAELQLQDASRRAVAQIQQVLRSIKVSRKSLQVSQEMTKVAQQTYDAAEERYEAGLGSSFEVTEASSSLYRALENENRALLALDMANAQFLFLTTFMNSSSK